MSDLCWALRKRVPETRFGHVVSPFWVCSIIVTNKKLVECVFVGQCTQEVSKPKGRSPRFRASPILRHTQSDRFTQQLRLAVLNHPKTIRTMAGTYTHPLVAVPSSCCILL